MPLKTYRRRKFGRKYKKRPVKSYRRRKFPIRKNPSSSFFSIYIKRNYEMSTVYAGALPVINQILFKLSDLPGYSALTAVFDYYLIHRVVVKFIPARAMFVGVDIPASTTIPRFATTIDYDDAFVIPSSVDILCENPNHRLTQATKYHSRSLRPRCLELVYNSALTNGYSVPRRSRMIDSRYPSVPHYGLVYGLDPTGTDSLWGYRINITYYVKFFGIQSA